MIRKNKIDLPLHYGSAPKWLFKRMARLSRAICIAVVEEFGQDELLCRLSDPYWFQALGCVIGFDWHSSGVTTTVCGALKAGLKDEQKNLGIFICGGKGATALATPQEIEKHCDYLGFDPANLIYASKMSAKVDNTAVQDGYNLYHHTFVFTNKQKWCVIQQGMNPENRYARRYHWFSDAVSDFVCQPHTAICCDARGFTLNMVAVESEGSRQACHKLAGESPSKLIQEFEKIKKLPQRHDIQISDINPQYLGKILLKTYSLKPQNFQKLLAIEGVGPKTIRALALLGEIIFGDKPSFEDPARFAFAHGGKDRHPYPVDRKTYDNSIQILESAIAKARIGDYEKMDMLKYLSRCYM